MKALLTRQETSDEGTFGKFSVDNGAFECYSGELPWRDNQPGISCIPQGTYDVIWAQSPKHGWCYHVGGVPSRTVIEIHSGNFCGDSSKGLKSDVEGCIILGNAISEIAGQKALLASKDAIARLLAYTEQAGFSMTIE